MANDPSFRLRLDPLSSFFSSERKAKPAERTFFPSAIAIQIHIHSFDLVPAEILYSAELAGRDTKLPHSKVKCPCRKEPHSLHPVSFICRGI